MKVLLHSHFPAGHALPMQALAQALAARGHSVVWLSSKPLTTNNTTTSSSKATSTTPTTSTTTTNQNDNTTTHAATNASPSPSPTPGTAVSAKARALAHLDEPLIRAAATGLFFASPTSHDNNNNNSNAGSKNDDPQRLLRLETRLAAQVADYRAVITDLDFRPDVLVVDVLPHGARALCDLSHDLDWAPRVYATLGVIPLYTSGPAAPFPASGKPPLFIRCSPTCWPRLIVNALCHAWHRYIWLPLRLRPVIDRQRAALGLDPLPFAGPAECYSYSSLLHIQASSPALEFNQRPRHRQIAANTAFVGPLVTQTEPSTDLFMLPSWWSDVVSHKRVVGITQGTLAVDPVSLIIPSVQALKDEPDTLLVVVSPHADQVRSRLGGLPNVRFAKWLPYHCLLPQLRLLITNGGYGSITQALSHGVPLVCAGQTEDKRDTAARVVWNGVGVDLKTDSPLPDQVRAAARTVLGDAGYQKRARVLGDELNRLGGAKRACELLEALVAKSKVD